jgi:hypothetical protein
MVYFRGPVNCGRIAFNFLISRIPRSAFTRPDNLPHCFRLDGRKALVDDRGLVSDDARVLLVGADLKSAPSTIDLGPKHLFSVAESVLLTARFGPRFCAQVAEVVSLGEVSKNYSKMTAVAKEVAAISYAHYTATSIANYLLSDVFGKRPKLVHKNTKAAAFEATEMAAETEAAARMEDIKRLAAEYEAMDCGAGTEALAQAAKPGDPLRERWSAHHLLHESDRRAARFGEMLSAREPAAAEAAEAAVAAAAAAEAAAASKAAAAHEAAAKAAAAANERRALDVRTPSKKPDLPKEPGGGAGLMDGEDFSGGGGVWSGGPGPRPRGDGAWVVAAPRHGLRRGHRDGLRPFAFARASTRRIPRPYIRGRVCINSYRDICLVF